MSKPGRSARVSPRGLLLGVAIGLPLSSIAAIPAASGAPDARAPEGNQVIVVEGYAQGRNDLSVWHDQCDTSDGSTATPAWTFSLRQDGSAPRGERIHGWTPTGTGWSRGVNAPIPRPTESSVFQMEVLAPGGHVSGFATAAYYPSEGGVWVGRSPVELDTDPSTWKLLDAGRANFSWSYYENGTFLREGGSAQLATFAEREGGDAHGARLAFTLGCDGSSFSFDNLVVGPPGASKIYDFEGYATRVKIDQTPKCSTSVKKFPAAVTVSGTLARRGKERWIGQSGRLELRAKGAKGLTGASANDNGRWSKTFKPTKPTRLFGYYAGSATDSPDRSSARSIRVYPQISVKQSKRVVTAGQQVVVSGQILPKAKHKITVLRTPWSKKSGWGAMKPALRTETDRQGRYRVVLKTRDVGLHAIDILSGSSKKASSAISRDSAIFEVRPRKKKSSGGGSTSGGSSAPAQGTTVGETSSPDSDPLSGGGYDNGSDDPFSGRPVVEERKVKGYSNCRWRKSGNPNKREVATRSDLTSDDLDESDPAARESVDSTEGLASLAPWVEPETA